MKGHNFLMNRSLIKKIAAFSVSLALASGSLYYTPVTQVTTFSPVHAEQTVDELEQLKEENKKRIELLQSEIDSAKEKYDSIVNDEKLKSDYREALNEKMALQNQNIDYVASQIDRLDEQISENVDKINILEEEIKQNDEDIQENLSLLKQRVRASYMSGSDSLSSVLTGSSDFFDMLAKFELVSRVAEHDDKLVKTLKSQIEELKDLQTTLRSQQNVLEENLASEQERKKEFTEALDLLAEEYMNTQKELERISGEKAEISLSIEEKEAAETKTKKSTYVPKAGTEKMVHLSLVHGRRFNPFTRKEESAPFTQLFTFAEWQLFKKNFKGLGYTIMEALHDPYGDAAELVTKNK